VTLPGVNTQFGEYFPEPECHRHPKIQALRPGEENGCNTALGYVGLFDDE
jgi:hypothetical protein